ncbi:S-layer domain-containing protein [Desulfofundulus kuznetsovii DSM 6115]|uniref:S-layer domain-containing protein n=1 Tax=Desulfofundulus kuznetsovii (strain DSM 6115 / VKM B-1805 / 17) TaxID=760568 RepID=A0AAU8PHP5_DESK7|nr:S-layer domain-containing protein [Desulfofundulus kuznetsovii DSM 6115]
MRKWLKCYRLPAVLLFLAAVIGLLFACALPGLEKARNRADAGAPGTPPGGRDKQVIDAGPESRGLYALHLSRRPRPAELEQLCRLAEVGDFTGGETLVVRCAPNRVKDLATLPFIREVKPYAPEEKLKTLVQAGLFATEKEPAETPAKDAAKPPGVAPAPDGASGDEGITVNLVVFHSRDKDDLALLVKASGGEVLRGLDEEGVVLRARLPRKELPGLASSPLVLRIEPYTAPRFLNDRAAGIVGARPLQAPGFVAPAGLNGAGQVVALADSGLGSGDLENLHPDLKDTPGQKPKVIMLKSWSGRVRADDPVGHGTHMAATIAGTGAASGGQFAGMAPGASLYFEGILNKEGKIDPPADLTALFRPAYAAAARIHVDGWGIPVNAYLSSAAQTDSFVRQNPDFLVIFGAGNSGPGAGTLTAEANSKNALVVGASESVRPSFGPASDNAGEVASFSSRGPAKDGRIRPDLVAPGTGIVSARSPLVKGNFPANPQYTRLQGTSMAAAVTGGAAALLRQYFQQEGLKAPSAALLKAALINGAAPVDGEGAGFGRLDLTATVLGLAEKTFLYADESVPLAAGDSKTYRFTVEDTSRPFKATLAWTDPPAEPGADRALVNDLDLVVVGPDGREYLGNDKGGGGRDDRNNVEQVLVPHPARGTYTVIVRGTDVRRGPKPASPPGQDFALVYGQPLAKKVIAAADEKSRQVRFTDGVTASFPGQGHIALGSKTPPWTMDHALPGAEAYVDEGNRILYIVGSVWRQNAVELLPLAAGTLLQEANPRAREGGFYLDRRAESPLWVNDSPAGVRDIPPGVRLWASINPTTQMAWRVWVWFREEEGIIDRVDLEHGQVYLLGRQKPYRLAAGAVCAFDDRLASASPEDLPYGYPVTGDPSQLAPGMKVRLMLSPGQDEVVYLAVQRTLAVGTVEEMDPGRSWLKLQGAGRYRLMPGLPATLDGEPASPGDIAPGDHVCLLLAGDQAISIDAHRQVIYGQVIFYKEESKSLLLVDSRNKMRSLTITPGTLFFRWGRPNEPSSLLPGEWVRVTLSGGAKSALRVDVAEVAAGGNARLDGLDPVRGTVNFSGDQEGRLSSRTLFTKNGYPVGAEDLLPGEEVEFTILAGLQGKTGVVAAIKARSRDGVPAPSLQAACRPAGDGFIVKGRTSATKIYLYTQEGDRLPVTPARGYFEINLPRNTGDTLQLVAVDSRSGGVTGEYLTVPLEALFSDLQGHWAGKEIGELAQLGLIGGYPGGKFHPEKMVTRAEFTLMLVRVLGWDGSGGRGPAVPASGGDVPGKSPDSGAREGSGVSIPSDLPSWAEKGIREAILRGIVSGYPDGTFKPDRPVNRAEAAAILARVLQVTGLVGEDGEAGSTGVGHYTQNTSTSDAHGGSPGGTGDAASGVQPRSPAAPGGSSTPVSAKTGSSPSYRDWNAVPGWARTAVALVTEARLMVGYPGGRFGPAQPLTRAQAAVIAWRLRALITASS